MNIHPQLAETFYTPKGISPDRTNARCEQLRVPVNKTGRKEELILTLLTHLSEEVKTKLQCLGSLGSRARVYAHRA